MSNEMKYNCCNCVHRPICSYKGAGNMTCSFYKNEDSTIKPLSQKHLTEVKDYLANCYN